MKRKKGGLSSFFLVFILSACSIVKAPATGTPTLTVTASVTPTVTRTATVPLPPTWTLIPSLTFTPTLSPTATLTMTPSETSIPSNPAQLFPYQDVEGHVIDWSYSRSSSYVLNKDGSSKSLSAYLAFQLLDRGIHYENIPFDGQDLTLYYLNAQHSFGGTLQPVKIILTATSGKDVPIASIPAGGNAFITLRLMTYQQSFDAMTFHHQANRTYADRTKLFPDVLLTDFEKLLPTLSNDLIVLVDATILYDADTLSSYTMKYQIDTVPYLAAREMPFIKLDDYNRIVGPSVEALALTNYVVYQKPITTKVTCFGSDALVLLVKSTSLPTLP